MPMLALADGEPGEDQSAHQEIAVDRPPAPREVSYPCRLHGREPDDSRPYPGRASQVIDDPAGAAQVEDGTAQPDQDGNGPGQAPARPTPGDRQRDENSQHE